jgi:hypothetical protein
MQEELQFATGINLSPRMKFISGATGTTERSAQAPSILIAYGEKAYQRIRRVNGIPSRIELYRPIIAGYENEHPVVVGGRPRV